MRRLVYFRILSIVFLLALLAAVIAPFLFHEGHADGIQYVFPNGDIYNYGDIRNADADHLIEQFAENPAEFRASGGGSIEIRVVEIRRHWRIRDNLLTGRRVWRLTAVTTYVTELEILIADGEVKEVRILETQPARPGPTKGTAKHAPTNHEEQAAE
jgi:hypothetical protein